MSVYPDGHPPFAPRGLLTDENIEQSIGRIAQSNFHDTLFYAGCALSTSRGSLEQLRVALFRAEQLIETEPLPVPCGCSDLPHSIDGMLETLEAARICLEQWKESQTCKAIVETFPRPKSNVT